MEPENLQHNRENPKDRKAIQEVINKVKSQGLFDQFRKECLADVDTKPAYHNLIQRVEKFVERFLNSQKWTSNVNKNQLRETLRRQLNNSGVMSIGVDRIIEQVVNPKILLGIKPKIDEAVCDHLGIDLKARQEEQQRRKHEQQRLMVQQQQLQQQHLQNLINQNVKAEDTFNPGILPTPGDLPWSQNSGNFLGSSVSGMPGPGGTNPVTGGPFNRQGMGFGGMMQPFSFMGPWGPGLPGMEGFNQTMNPMIPGQPMIPAFGPGGFSPGVGGLNSSSAHGTSPMANQSTPDFSKPPPGLSNTPLLSSSSSIGSSPGVPGLSLQSSPVAPPGIHPAPVGSIIRPPPPGSVPPPPGTVPVLPPGATMAPPVSPMLRPNVPTTPNIPALISHTLSKVSKDELTPEKIAVFKTAAAFITKTVNNAQGTPGADLATMFSPRVLAEAMMAESGVPLTKHEIRAAKRKERMKEFERLKAEREKEEEKRKAVESAQEDPLPPKHNLMDVFDAAEDVSDDEESFNMLIDCAETEDKHKQGIVLSDDSDKGEEEQPPTSQPGKRYNFAWDVDKDIGELSDVTVSSIHTSDISSFEDLSSGESESENEKEDSRENAEETEVKSKAAGESSEHEDKAVQETPVEEEKPAEEQSISPINNGNEQKVLKVETEEPIPSKDQPAATDICEVYPSKTADNLVKDKSAEVVKPRKLVSLQYNYSDSDEEETREERKARIAKEKEERYLKRQQRRAEIEAKRKEREEEKARLKEEKKKQKEENKSESQEDQMSQSIADVSVAEDANTSTTSTADQDSPVKTSTRKRRNKAEIKEQLHQQKVLERKAALRRQRTRNRRYTSEEFTSIFSERKTLNQSYTEPVLASQEIVTFDGSLEIVEMTVDQECVVETVGDTVEVVVDADKMDDLTLQCPSPYSDISDKSMSDKSDDQQMAVEMEQVSSDEDLDSGDNNTEDDTNKDIASSKQDSDSDEGQLHEQDDLSTRITSRSRLGSSQSGGDLLKEGVDQRKSPEVLENRRSQRYDVDDLYKPRTIHRRVTTPPVSGSDSKSQKDLSDDEKASQLSSGEVTKNPALVAAIDNPKESIVESTSVEGETDNAKEPVDIMADLELEPVSDEDSPLDELGASSPATDVDKEDGEERDSDKETASVKRESSTTEVCATKNSTNVKEEEEASDEGEIKSDSDEAVEESKEDKERNVYKKPIELVDFGEAEKRARGTRSYYPEATDRRRGSSTQTLTHSSYRGAYPVWTPIEPSNYSSTSSRFPVTLDGITPTHVKSPIGTPYDGADSEASSHSRSSVRVRDDIPPPYPIEGVSSRKHRSPGSDQGSSSVYKPPVSPPSPVSSSSRSLSSSSSRSRSSSCSSSRSSSSSSSNSSRHKKKLARKQKRRRKSRNNDSEKTSSIRSLSKLPNQEKNFSPIKTPDIIPKPAADPTPVERRLSSGHESISSDELPYFPDEEPQPPSPPKVKVRKKRSRGKSASDSSSSPPAQKRKRSEGSSDKASISSSELLYSPTRRQAQISGQSKEDVDEDQDSIERPPMSPGRSSISSGELPDYPDQDQAFMEGFSPHHPPLPSEIPPLPQDIDGFQPPLPPSPPLSFNVRPPLPPSLPFDDPIPPFPSDEEEGEIIDDVQVGYSTKRAEHYRQELNISSPEAKFNVTKALTFPVKLTEQILLPETGDLSAVLSKEHDNVSSHTVSTEEHTSIQTTSTSESVKHVSDSQFPSDTPKSNLELHQVPLKPSSPQSFTDSIKQESSCTGNSQSQPNISTITLELESSLNLPSSAHHVAEQSAVSSPTSENKGIEQPMTVPQTTQCLDVPLKVDQSDSILNSSDMPSTIAISVLSSTIESFEHQPVDESMHKFEALTCASSGINSLKKLKSPASDSTIEAESIKIGVSTVNEVTISQSNDAEVMVIPILNDYQTPNTCSEPNSYVTSINPSARSDLENLSAPHLSPASTEEMKRIAGSPKTFQVTEQNTGSPLMSEYTTTLIVSDYPLSTAEEPPQELEPEVNRSGNVKTPEHFSDSISLLENTMTPEPPCLLEDSCSPCKISLCTPEPPQLLKEGTSPEKTSDAVSDSKATERSPVMPSLRPSQQFLSVSEALRCNLQHVFSMDESNNQSITDQSMIIEQMSTDSKGTTELKNQNVNLETLNYASPLSHSSEKVNYSQENTALPPIQMHAPVTEINQVPIYNTQSGSDLAIITKDDVLNPISNVLEVNAGLKTVSIEEKVSHPDTPVNIEEASEASRESKSPELTDEITSVHRAQSVSLTNLTASLPGSRKRLLDDPSDWSDTSAASSESSQKKGRKVLNVDNDTESSSSRPGTRLHQQQELAKPLTRGRSNSMPSRDTRQRKEKDKSPPAKKAKR
ncbi:unnamed protein product [Lymnaea stagnalis]|uniref:BOD1/SHG1 domain-containing protein n=1 Tax=Lymnaea stagnalis TaxID=6523 RepID=A0AAV2GYG4_LYMST